MRQLIKMIFLFALLIFLGFGISYGQYNISLVTNGNGAGKLTGNNYSALFVAGQNVIGKTSDSNYTAYLGLLAPLTFIVTDVSAPELKETFQLQNYPNPFRGKTTISFNIARETDVRLSVLNILGQEEAVLLNRKMPAGRHSVDFNTGGKKPGVYFYQVQAGDTKSVRKMILMD